MLFRSNDIEIIKAFASKTYDKDGFGAIIRTKNNDILTLKALDSSSFYIDLITLIQNKDVSELVVHHRTSTNGAGIDYAHPFEFQGYYLTHNGVVSVPGIHKTKTMNDSEALLHHLIKTNYETKTIQGYFSCFILNKEMTQVIVDGTAPIYSDNRVYSSHKLSEEMKPVTCKHIVVGVSSKDIEIEQSDYGQDKAHLSIGYYSEIAFFWDNLTPQDESYLARCSNRYELISEIKILADLMYCTLSDQEIEEIADIFNESETLNTQNWR